MSEYSSSAAVLRKKLHGCPETSMAEIRTKSALIDYLSRECDHEIIDRGCWFYAAYRYDESSESVAIRADFDAVTGEDGVSRHLCGHDGHAAILASFAKWISDNKPKKNVFLVFQPGEESGEGAKICCELFSLEHIDKIFGLHNIPGKPLGTLLLKKGTFACASEGLEIKLAGKPAHAAYPEFGINPAEAISKIVLGITQELNKPHRGIVLSTVIGIEAGSDHYGVSASDGLLRLTVRAEFADEFSAIVGFIRSLTAAVAREYGLEYSISEKDVFPSTENHDSCVALLEKAAGKAGLNTEELNLPMRWSEDFGHFLGKVQGAFFGIGAGENCAELHTAGYEYPDEITPFAHRIFAELCK